jgi:L-fuconolactonase
VTLDAHIHVWKTDDGQPIWIRDQIGALGRTRSLDDFAADAGEAHAILVQAAETEAETLALCRLGEATPVVEGVVGWVDLHAPDVADRIDRIASSPMLRGVRLILAFGDGAADVPASALRELARRRLALDVLATPEQLHRVLRMQEVAPDLRIVVNHCGRPRVMCGLDPAWRTAMLELGRSTAAVCKLSGLIERAGIEWNARSLAPFVAVVLEAFGPARLAFASNWPMLELVGRHARWTASLAQLLDDEGVDEAGREAIFGETGRSAYGIGSPVRPGGAG